MTKVDGGIGGIGFTDDRYVNVCVEHCKDGVPRLFTDIVEQTGGPLCD